MSGPTFTHALVRQVSRSLAECSLTHLPRSPIDLSLASRQHEAYVATLRALDIDVTVLPEEPELADAVFVEDTAVMLDELAVMGRPGQPSRQPEGASIATALAGLRSIARIEAPGTLEGGDVLAVDRTLFVGFSKRTNGEGLRQFASLVAPNGYRVVPVTVHGCLHLKTAATVVAPGVVLANPQWVDVAAFTDSADPPGLAVLTVPSGEPWGANTLWVNGTLLVAAAAPRTAELLESRSLRPQPIDIAELQKAEAGLTCLSLLYNGKESR